MIYNLHLITIKDDNDNSYSSLFVNNRFYKGGEDERNQITDVYCELYAFFETFNIKHATEESDINAPEGKTIYDLWPKIIPSKWELDLDYKHRMEQMFKPVTPKLFRNIFNKSKVYLENTTYNHDKFWNVEVNGCIMWVNYGKRGTKGTLIKKDFPSYIKAKAYAVKKLNEKLREGYEEI